MNMKDQVIKFDILRNDPNQVEVVGHKEIKVVNATQMLNHKNWIERPRLTDREPTLPLSNYKGVGKSRCLTEMQRGCFGYLLSNANDIQNSVTGTALFSGVAGKAHGIYVNADNIEKVMITFAVRRIGGGNAKWTNDRDQFMIPHTLTDTFTNDCIIWSLANGSNSTSSLKDFPHEGKDYTVTNEFFPFLPKTVTNNWKSTGLPMPNRTPYLAQLLETKTLSDEAQAVYDALLEMYQVTLAHIKELPLTFRREEYLTSWDLGYRQIDAAYKKLTEMNIVDGSHKEKVKQATKSLEAEIAPKIYEFGFLPEETWFE